jgi:hypothetical protein
MVATYHSHRAEATANLHGRRDGAQRRTVPLSSGRPPGAPLRESTTRGRGGCAASAGLLRLLSARARRAAEAAALLPPVITCSSPDNLQQGDNLQGRSKQQINSRALKFFRGKARIEGAGRTKGKNTNRARPADEHKRAGKPKTRIKSSHVQCEACR